MTSTKEIPVKAIVIKEATREQGTTKLIGQTLYIWSTTPNMPYNAGQVVVSRQPSGNGLFCFPTDCLRIA
jgi:hypothetical protein